MIPTERDAYQLLHNGALAFADIERHGMCVDVEYLDRMIERTGTKIARLTSKLKSSKFFADWCKTFGQRTNMGSREQLGHVLFVQMKCQCTQRTATGKPKVDEAVLETIDIPEVKAFLEIEKLKKARSTYLVGIRREVCDGVIHPFFNLNLVRSFRSSSDHPNFQNMPIRDKKIGKLIRSCFVPRKGNRIVELDYSGIEVRIAACYHKDQNMLRYINDPESDMHRDMAQQIYFLRKKQMTKEIRFCTKSYFVFAQFYGDYYINCARSLWNTIDRDNIVLADGTPMKEHLKKKGIERLGLCDHEQPPLPGTFEQHLKAVENDFWNNRFKEYGQWKWDWWNAYCKTGEFQMLSGFKVHGHYDKKQVINYPIQGAAFHCLLWSLIRINKWLKRNKMKTRIVGQIHDSIVADVAESELNEYLHKANQISTVSIRRAWPWIITPLEIEAEATEVDQAWFYKKPIAIPA
uniref:Putative DNA polymerase n=1 Tax=viral metagenome TaxID=1070528 RepID=A0A6M3K2P3_9ZZZZ